MCKPIIVSVKCPYCGEKMYKHDRVIQVGPQEWIHKITWRCSGKCVYIFSEEWFNDPRFGQFESCVTRASKPKDLNTSDAY